MYLNKVYYAGNLGADAKVYGDASVTSLFLIYNHKYKNKDGEQKEESCAMSVKVFGWAAKKAAKFRKGDNIIVDGLLVENKFTDKNGNEVQTKEIKAFSAERIEKYNSSEAPESFEFS